MKGRNHFRQSGNLPKAHLFIKAYNIQTIICIVYGISTNRKFGKDVAMDGGGQVPVFVHVVQQELPEEHAPFDPVWFPVHDLFLHCDGDVELPVPGETNREPEIKMFIENNLKKLFMRNFVSLCFNYLTICAFDTSHSLHYLFVCSYHIWTIT